MASLTSGQSQFAASFAKSTGLNPRVVGSWLLAEQNGSAAQYYQSKGYNNWLNIARTDSGDASGAHSKYWSNPVTAGRVAAEWMRGQGPIAREYGKPSGGIMGILGSHAKGPMEQISAIAGSGWASSGYNGGSTLRSLYNELGNVKLPNVQGGPSGTTANVAGSRIPGQRVGVNYGGLAGLPEQKYLQMNEAGYQKAKQEAESNKTITSLPGGKEFRSLLPGTMPKISEFLNTKTLPAVAGIPGSKGSYTTPGSATPGAQVKLNAQGYTGALPKGSVLGRIDQGVDATAKPGDPLRAIGNGRVTRVDSNFYNGEPAIYYELTSGPQKGQVIYLSEQIRPNVKTGDRVKAGQQIATYAPSGTGLELGYGTKGPNAVPLAKEQGGYAEGQQTAAGKRYRQLIRETEHR